MLNLGQMFNPSGYAPNMQPQMQQMPAMPQMMGGRPQGGIAGANLWGMDHMFNGNPNRDTRRTDRMHGGRFGNIKYPGDPMQQPWQPPQMQQPGQSAPAFGIAPQYQGEGPIYNANPFEATPGTLGYMLGRQPFYG